MGTARHHLAEGGGAQGASYNKIIADCGISKTSAYLYFDGKDDLVAEVVRGSIHRVLEALGPWRAAKTPATFWKHLRRSANNLRDFVAASPEDLAVLQATYSRHSPPLAKDDAAHALGWFDDLLDNGVELGVIRRDVDRALLRLATISLFRTIDTWALEAMGSGDETKIDLKAGFRLLASLWTE